MYKRKGFIVLFVMFMIQTFFSCVAEDDDCSGGNSSVFDYDTTYTGVTITAFDSLGFNSLDTTNQDVDKNSFGILVDMQIDFVKIAALKNKFEFINLGFQSSYACSPPESQYFYEDPIKALKIYMLTEQSDIVIDVTDNFVVNDYYYKTGEVQSILLDELFPIDNEEYHNFYNIFNMELIDYEDIPNQVSFEVEVTLISGINFTQQTDLISFKS